LPSSQQLTQPINIAGFSYQQVFFLPEVCNLPFGMGWPTSIGFSDFSSSIRAPLEKAVIILSPS
jgi:hypothetical protein